MPGPTSDDWVVRARGVLPEQALADYRAALKKLAAGGLNREIGRLLAEAAE